MVFPNTVLGTKVELFYDDAWHNIVTDTPLGVTEPNSRVRGQGAEDGEIEITARGQPDESSKLQPTQAKLSINNKDGKYTPRNTMSPLYGKIGLNTPLRISTDLTSTVDVVDSFDTDGTNGWPISDSGHTWTVNGTASEFLVTGGEALHRHASNNRLTTELQSLTITDFDCYARGVRVEATPTGANVEAGIRGRYVDGSNYVEGRIFFTTGNTITQQIRYFVGGVETGTAFIALSGGTTTETFDIRFQAEGRTLRFKAWESTVAEPSAWSVELETTHLTPGFISVTSGISGANSNAKPYDVFFGSVAFSLGIILFTGEVVEWPKRWDSTGTDVWVPIVATGLTRRKRQGNRPARSALYNYIIRELPVATLGVAPGPQHYWPMEDLAQQTREIRCELDGTTVLEFDVAVHNSVEWGSNDFVVGSGKLVTITGLPIPEGVISVPFISNFNAPPLGGGTFETPDVADPATFTFACWFYFPSLLDSFPLLPATSLYFSFAMPDSLIQNIFVDVQYRPDTAEIDVTIDSTSGDLTGSGTIPYTDTPHFLMVDCFSNGTMTLDVYIDGLNAASDSAATRPFEHVTRFDIETEPYSPVTIGHIMLETAEIFTSILSFSDVLEEAGAGFPGETAVERFVRVLTSEGLTYEVFEGELDTDFPTIMGAQKTGNFIDYLDDIQLADDGIIYELRTPFGYGFRTRQSLYGIPDGAHLELDYTATDLAEVPDVNDDDLLTRNIVRAKLRGGPQGEITVTESTGPLGTDIAGDYEVGGIEVALNDTDQLRDWVGRRAFLGTWDEDRWPALTVYLHRAPFTSNLEKWVKAAILEIGEIISVDNKPVWLGDDTGVVLQQMRSVQIRLSNFQFTITWSLIPGGPWAALNELDNPDMSRVDTVDCALLSAVDDDDTEFLVVTDLTETPTDTPLWTTDPSEFDAWGFTGMEFRVNPATRAGGLGGEKVTVGVVHPISDTFTRSASQLAGTNTDTGQTWVLGQGTATNFTVNGSSAVALHTAANTPESAVIPIGDFDMSAHVTVAWNFTSATGTGDFRTELAVRATDIDNCYLARLVIPVGTDDIVLQVFRFVGAVGTNLSGSITIGDNVSGTPAHIRVSVVGRKLLAKAWIESTEEPEWQYVGYDAASDALNGTNAIIKSFRLTGNTNANAATTWDSFQVHTPKIRPYVWDRFNRTALNDPTASFPNQGLGQSYSWFTAGAIGANELDFTPNQLTMTLTAANAYAAVYLGDIDIEDAVTSVIWTVEQAAGASLEPGCIMMRGVSNVSYVLFRPTVNTSNQVTLEINAANGASLGTASTNIEHIGTTKPLKTKAACYGTTCMMKVWDPTQPEPYDWQLVVTDPAAVVSGWIGMRAGRASGNTNTNPPVTFHEFRVENPQRIDVVRSANGVEKSWDAGSDFRLWSPIRLG